MSISFILEHKHGDARCGRIETPHETILTPVFMPVGTAATVKSLPHEWLEYHLDAKIILPNTYHLYLRPGIEVIEEQNGLHRFMAWDRAILTDSGGYQVFSQRELRHIDEDGVTFRSHLDGSRHFLSPERVMQIQSQLRSDITMVLDECTPFPVSHCEAKQSMERSMRWAERCRKEVADRDQAVFGIVQGGMFSDLREQSLEMLLDMQLAGIALGGFSVGEPRQMMYDLVNEVKGALPIEKPRYLMGVGTPLDILHCVEMGVDMFDCVLPTRNARNGTLFTWAGKVQIKNAVHKNDSRPLDSKCACPVCQRYSRSYLRHLFVSGEILAATLLTLHNLYFYKELMGEIRRSILEKRFFEFKKGFMEHYSS